MHYSERLEKIERLKEKRRRELWQKVIVIIVTIILLVVLAICVKGNDTYGYYIHSDNGNTHYKWVNEYVVNATYLGNDEYLDTNGNVYECSATDKEVGIRYEIVLHDNGTDYVDDDVITAIVKESR